MKLRMLCMATFAVTSVAALAEPAQVELVTARTLASYVRATKDGLAVHPAFQDTASTAVIVRRAASGEVERHKSMSDIMVARAGNVSVLLGGSIEGGHETTPGEWRGGRIVGGTKQTLSAGDMLWIPAGIPHQMILQPGRSFTYLAIKVPSH